MNDNRISIFGRFTRMLRRTRAGDVREGTGRAGDADSPQAGHDPTDRSEVYDDPDIPAFLRRRLGPQHQTAVCTPSRAATTRAASAQCTASRATTATSSRDRLTSAREDFARLRVVGVGGAGVAAVNRMIADSLYGVEFIAVDTDSESLARSDAPVKSPIGERVSGAVGTGGRPEMGEGAAAESAAELGELLEGSDLVYIVAGMGGGTGTGAASVIARIAKEEGAVAVGVVSTPYESEGPLRQQVARAGVQWLEDEADSVIVIPCEHFHEGDGGAEIELEPYLQLDEGLSEAVRAATSLVTVPGLMCLDFYDVREVLCNHGIAVFGTAIGVGEDRSVEAMQRAMASPVVDLPIVDSPGIILNVTGGLTLGLYEVNQAVSMISCSLQLDTHLVPQAVIDEKMGERVRTSYIATGFPSELLWRERQAAGSDVPIELRMPATTEEVCPD